MFLDLVNSAPKFLNGLLHAFYRLLDYLRFFLPGTPINEFLDLVEFEAHVVKARFNLRNLRLNFLTLIDRI